MCIAAHFDISVQKYGIKKEIKNKVLEKLIELKVLVAPVDPAQSRPEAPPDSVPFAGPCASSVLDDMEEQRAAQATPLGDMADREAPPATLPRFEPFSPESWI